MKSLLYTVLMAAALALSSCGQQNSHNVIGHWKVVQQFSEGKEVESATEGLTFEENGVLSYDWVDGSDVSLPPMTYRISGDTLFWETEVDPTTGEPGSEGQIAIEWDGNRMILKRNEGDYTVLSR